MVNYCLFLLVNCIYVLSLDVKCDSNQRFQLESNTTYEIRLKSELNTASFLIGRKGSPPSISYDSSSKAWSSELDIYSLSSYKNQLPYLNFTSDSDAVFYFSLCSFQNISNPSILEIQELPTQNNPDCGKHGKAKNGRCECEKGYFGVFCELEYYTVSSDYSKKFKVKPYSLTFFLIDSKYEINYEDKYSSTHVFYARDRFPSFFDFDGYRVRNKTKKPKKAINAFSLFCASDEMCEFKVTSGNNQEHLGIDVIVALSVVFGVIFVLIFLAVWFRIRYTRKTREAVVVDKNQLDNLAPLEKFQGKNETCSICLSDFEKNEEIRKIKKCEHIFHVTCIDEWLMQKAVCPNCNTKLV